MYFLNVLKNLRSKTETNQIKATTPWERGGSLMLTPLKSLHILHPCTLRHRFVFIVNMLLNICRSRRFSNSRWPAAGLRVSPAAGSGGLGVGGARRREPGSDSTTRSRRQGHGEHSPLAFLVVFFPVTTHPFLLIYLCLLFPAKWKSFWWRRKEM